MTPWQITIPLPTTTEDDEILDIDSISRVESRPSQVSFFGQTVKLFIIIGKILSKVYKPWSVQGAKHDFEEEGNKSHSKTVDLETVVSFEEEIANFEDNIPPWLHWERGIHIRESLTENQRLLLQKQTSLLQARSVNFKST